MSPHRISRGIRKPLKKRYHDLIGIFKKNHSDYSVENIVRGESKGLWTYSEVKAAGKKDEQ